jgi:pimeloyl-ACP methyl ester carboxylesterase
MPKAFMNGIDLYYQIQGSGSPIVLVHGLGMDHSMWDLQVEAFSGGYQVITYDLRGHGQSDSPDLPYSIDLFAEDLDQFLHFLGLRKAAILGLSLGGRILIRFALKYPGEVQAVILADAQSETPPESMPTFQELAEVARKEGMDKAAELFFSWPSLRGLARRDAVRFERERKRFLRASPIGLANSCLAIGRMEALTGQLGSIQAPTLALAGEEDEPYLPYLDIYAREIPGCRKEVISRAGHLSSLENPQAFNESVLSFLNTLGKA